MFKLIKWLITIAGSAIFGMWGGQKNKGVRRFGIPSFAVIMAWLSGNLRWKHLSFLLLIPILSMGYGVNSILMSLLHNEILVRLVYSLLLALPFIFFGIKRWLIASISLGVAFAIRAGSLGQIWGYDILIEDIVRYSVLGFNIALNIFVD